MFMATGKKRVNPFYVLLVLAGVAFALTACAYGVMTVKELHAAQAAIHPSHVDGSTAQMSVGPGFVQFMDQQGPRLMLFELIALALTTFAAMGTDRFWSAEGERAAAAQDPIPSQPSSQPPSNA